MFCLASLSLRATESITEMELMAIAEAVVPFPPLVYDVTILGTLEQLAEPEIELRRQAKRYIEGLVRQERPAGIVRSPQELSELENQEFQRRLAMSSHPMRYISRWRNDGLRFRVDESFPALPNETVDPTTLFGIGEFYTQSDPADQGLVIMLGYNAKSFNIMPPPFTKRRRVDVWAGGTFGFKGAVLLKALFKIPLFDNGSQKASPLTPLTSDENSDLKAKITVTRMPGFRKFEIKTRNGIVYNFKTPSDSILPLSEEEFFTTDGKLSYRMTVNAFNEKGDVKDWRMVWVNDLNSSVKETWDFKYVNRQLGGTLPEDTFALTPPPGWNLYDGRIGKAWDADGNPIPIAPQPIPIANKQSLPKQSQILDSRLRSKLMGLGMAIGVGIAVYAVLNRLARRRIN